MLAVEVTVDAELTRPCHFGLLFLPTSTGDSGMATEMLWRSSFLSKHYVIDTLDIVFLLSVATDRGYYWDTL